ncbi:MAG: NADPH:quinone oxidoreductase family protein [Sphingobium sp.]
MKAVVAHALGAPESFAIENLPDPLPAAGQVRIAVAYAGLTYVDALVAAGKYQVKPPLPFIPGSEFSGVIDAVGEGVPQSRVGQRVCASAPGGTYAGKAVVPEQEALPLPADMPLDIGAIILVSYATSYYALAIRGAVQPGETVVVLGAGGAVGFAAVQLAKAMGARVIASASSAEKRAMTIAGGADAAVDARAADWRDQVRAANDGKPVDIIYDPVSGDATEPAFRSLGWGGRHLVVGFASGSIAKLPVNLPLLKGASMVGVDYRQAIERDPPLKLRINAAVMDLYVEGRIAPKVARVFAFEDFAPAMNAAAKGAEAGRLLLAVNPQ